MEFVSALAVHSEALKLKRRFLAILTSATWNIPTFANYLPRSLKSTSNCSFACSVIVLHLSWYWRWRIKFLWEIYMLFTFFLMQSINWIRDRDVRCSVLLPPFQREEDSELAAGLHWCSLVQAPWFAEVCGFDSVSLAQGPFLWDIAYKTLPSRARNASKRGKYGNQIEGQACGVKPLFRTAYVTS